MERTSPAGSGFLSPKPWEGGARKSSRTGSSLPTSEVGAGPAPPQLARGVALAGHPQPAGSETGDIAAARSRRGPSPLAGHILLKTPRLPSQPRAVASGSSGDRGQDPPAAAGDGARAQGSPLRSRARRAGRDPCRAGGAAGCGRGSPRPRRRSGRPGAGPRGPPYRRAATSAAAEPAGAAALASPWRAVGSVPAGCAGGAGGDAVEGGAAESPPLDCALPLGDAPTHRGHSCFQSARLSGTRPPGTRPTSPPPDSPPSRSAHPQDTPPTPGASPGPPVPGCCRPRARGWQDGGGLWGGAA